MKIIFLDIDGVLNSIAWQRSRPPKPSGIITDALAHWRRSIDPACIQRLNWITEATGAQIVISSSWRTMLGFYDLCDVLRDAGLTERVIGLTPEIQDLTRYGEIFRWLATALNTAEGRIDYIILDDDPMPGAPPQNFIRTDYKTGLTDKDAQKAIRILNTAA